MSFQKMVGRNVGGRGKLRCQEGVIGAVRIVREVSSGVLVMGSLLIVGKSVGRGTKTRYCAETREIQFAIFSVWLF